MDACNTVSCPRNPPLHYPSTLPEMMEIVETSTPQYSAYQPVFNRYHHMLDDTELGHGACGNATPPSSRTDVDTCSATTKWAETGDDDGHIRKSASRTSGSRSQAKKTGVMSIHGTTGHPEPVAIEIDSVMDPLDVAEVFLGPPPYLNDYANPMTGPFIIENTSHKSTEDVEMTEAGDRFEEDVMLYYHAAIASSGYDLTLDMESLSEIAPMSTSGSDEYGLEDYSASLDEEFVEAFAKARTRDLESLQLKMGAGRHTKNFYPPQVGYKRSIYEP